MFLVYRQKYLKTKKIFISASIKKNLIKFIKGLIIYQKKFVSAVFVKTVLFVINLSLFINNMLTTMTMKKTQCYGRFTQKQINMKLS